MPRGTRRPVAEGREADHNKKSGRRRVLLNVRYGPIATKYRSAAVQRVNRGRLKRSLERTRQRFVAACQ